MRLVSRLLLWLFASLLSLGLVGLIAAAVAYAMLSPGLPSVDSLRDVRLQVPLRVVTREGALIAEYGEQRRIPLEVEALPPQLVQAFLAAEDDRFFDHPGVDYQGIARAVRHLLLTGEKGPGGSTITMQLARNFFLTREQTFHRKAQEILLALQIERTLSKEEILELYLNKIYLGQRAYGVGAAAQIYYGKPVEELDLAQMAMIAGLPKAPSAYNPIANPRRAEIRRAYVLGRMLAEGYITSEQHAEAVDAPLTAQVHASPIEVSAPYVAEMVRQTMVAQYGEEAAYTDGFVVRTTIDGRMQRAADKALRDGLRAYDHRRGYRGPEAQVTLNGDEGEEGWARLLADYPRLGGLDAALVLAVDDEAGRARVWVRRHGELELPFEGMAWARPYLRRTARGPAPEKVSDVVSVGDIIRVDRASEVPQLAAVPAVEGALVALDPEDGGVLALSGGFDYFRSAYNRAVQSRRQPGSAFKPFIYSAALSRGYSPASMLSDTPIVMHDESLETSWRPSNYSGRVYGPTRLREALVHSRNLASIRLLRNLGIEETLAYLDGLGFDTRGMPNGLSLALGSAEMTPLDLTAGYALFANGGFRVMPHFIDRVERAEGEVLFQARPPVACVECSRLQVQTDLQEEAGGLALQPVAESVMPATDAFLMTSIMQDVIQRGTGRAARQLGRNDLAGKTGTTNDGRDAWFVGYNSRVVAGAWVGFDNNDQLGPRETGSSAALPVWTDFMAVALNGVPESPPRQPDGLVTVRIDPEDGRRVRAGEGRGMFELFREDNLPEVAPRGGTGGSGSREQDIF